MSYDEKGCSKSAYNVDITVHLVLRSSLFICGIYISKPMTVTFILFPILAEK